MSSHPTSEDPPAAKVSFILRVKNEARHFRRCLEQIRAQRWPGPVEIVVIDSGSTDDTVAIAREFAELVMEIRPEEFHYSRTLNQAIETSNGEFIAILSGHSVIQGEDWLAQMMSGFADPLVAGVGSRQIPWPEANWSEVRRIAAEFPPGSRGWERGGERQVFFSNAASVVRRSAWAEHPFDMPAAEDLYWARWALQQGYRIRYETAAEALHSHRDSPRQRAERLATLDRAECLGEGRDPGPVRMLVSIAGLLFRELRAVWRHEAGAAIKLGFLADVLRTIAWYVPLRTQDDHASDLHASSTRGPFGGRRGLIVFLAVAFGVSVMRFIALDADPSWIPAALADEGAAASGARGKVLFGDYFADGLGAAWLTSPLHTWLLELAYGWWGVGNVQTRLVAAVPAALMILLLPLFAYRLFGARSAMVIAIFLGLDGVLFAHGRLGSADSLQALLIGSAALLLLTRAVPGTGRSILAGGCLGMAFAVRPTTLACGLVPLLAAFLVQSRWQRSAPGVAVQLAKRGATALASAIAVLAVFLAAVWLPHLDRFLDLLPAELPSPSLPDSGASMALLAGTWLHVLAAACGAQQNENRRLPRNLLVWSYATLLAVTLLEPMRSHDEVMLAAALVLPTLSYLRWWIDGGLVSAQAPRPGRRLAVAALLTLPLLFATGPWLTAPAHVVVGLATWAVASAGLAWFAGWQVWRLSSWVSRRLGWALVLGALVFQAAGIASYFLRATFSLREQQAVFGSIIARGERVAGAFASAVFLPLPVRTLAHAMGDGDPPRYVLDHADPARQATRALIERDYSARLRFGLVPDGDGEFALELVLYERLSGR